jgi:hypothetical protein
MLNYLSSENCCAYKQQVALFVDGKIAACLI